jgi:menaquinone-dependent protoporphyrinogen oxidase
MSKKILIAYASHTGTATGVAEFIGKSLADEGHVVDIIPVHDVKDMAPYQVIVVGSAIQAAKLLPEAMEFLENHKIELNTKLFAVYLVCMTLAMKKAEKYRHFVSGWLEPVRMIAKPVSEGLFSGKLDISKVPNRSDRIKFRLSVLMGIWKEGDNRDWNAIGEWVSDLKGKIQL